ncbi:MAG: hypothetical protein IJ308_05325 [Clostridia bacterium]|nr:hypothetical protein [Clostridia bacterium]
MKSIDYQTPQLLILLFNNEDVLTTSNFVGNETSESFDKGVEDFFGE